jgi:hypothetical protein
MYREYDFLDFFPRLDLEQLESFRRYLPRSFT